MSITNLPKPSSTSNTIGAGTKFMGFIMQYVEDITVAASGQITNTNKVSIGETWGAITSTWASEPRTWLAVSQLIGNTTKPSSSMTNQTKP